MTVIIPAAPQNGCTPQGLAASCLSEEAMIQRVALSALIALSAGVVSAQEPAVERVLSFRYAETPQSWQEINNAVRSIADIKEATMNPASRTLNLRGPATRMAAAEWIFHELDRPNQPAIPNSDIHDFRPAGTADVVVSVYYPERLHTPMALQEVVNAVRSIADIPYLFPVNAVNAVVMRGTAAQIALAKWAFQQLDGPPPANRTTEFREFHSQWLPDAVVRVFFLATLRDPQAIQEVVNATRTIADVQRFFPVNQLHAITMRGTAAQAELCAWLVNRLDTPATPVAGEYLFPGSPTGVVRLFVPAKTPTIEVVKQLQIESKAQKVFLVSTRSAVAFRGTAEQAAIAERALQ
jgi:hypothetical protein